MGLGKLFFKLINREYYKNVPLGLLFLNWIVQRVFRINSEVPFSVHYTSKITGYKYMNIHPSSRLSFAVSSGAYIVGSAKGRLTLGENVIFACNVCIQTINHDLVNRKIHISKDVVINNNCWLGNGVTILAGVKLEENTTVGANSVVTKSFSKNKVLGGVPAKLIKSIEE